MNPTYEHHRPYDGCDLYRGDALDVLPCWLKKASPPTWYCQTLHTVRHIVDGTP